MKIIELLAHLQRLNVELWLEGDRLRYRAPNGVFTPELRAMLSEHKAEICAVLKQAQRGSQHDGPIPLSFAQQRLWFLDQLQPGSHAYTIPLVVRLLGTLDVAALEQSLAEIIRRHEVLRTTFAIVDGQPSQLIAPADSTTSQLALAEIDLSDLEAAEQASAVDQLVREAFVQPFDLQRGPLIRATLIRLHGLEHVLMFMLHHIIFDGWSQNVFIAELTRLYTNLSERDGTRRAPALPELPLQYADYALWQHRWLKEAGLEQQMGYWRRQLQDLPVLQLMTDYPRPATATSQGVDYYFALPDECTAALDRLSQRENCTPFMTLLTAWQVLLSRYTAQADIVVGTPIANRTHADSQKLIGFFVNTLVLRTDLSGNPSFREAMQRVREVCLGAFAHQDVPFDKLVEEFQPEHVLSHHPLFQVMFAYQHAPAAQPTLPNLRLELVPLEIDQVKFDLNLTFMETGTGLAATLKYRTDLFAERTIARMADQLRVLLAAISSDPDLRIDNLPLLAAAEYHELLHSSRATHSYVVEHGLHQAFEQQAARTPDAVAVAYEGSYLTYAELNSRANQLARHLQSLGVEPEVCVGLLVERSIDLIVGLLGILKAGGAYLPLEPSLPSERLQFMLADARVSVLVTQAQLTPLLPDPAMPIVALDADAETIAQYPRTNPASRVLPDHPAYVIYTSGSTGTPKGVIVTHANVRRLFTATQDWFAFDARDVWTMFHSAAFDFSVWEIWGPLLTGGKLVVVPYLTSRSPEAFYDLLCAEGVTVLNQTPSAFRQLIQRDSVAGEGELALRLVIFGGEALDLQSLQPWFARHGDRRPQLVNMYGITETTVHVTYRPLRMADLQQSASVIGGAISDLEVYLLDRYLQPVPLGVPGEIYVGGDGLARGYLYRPALTAERFVPHPFSTTPGQRLYKSGDLARYGAQGELEYLGRIDQQIKIRGFRIEIGEIEVVLGQHPAVREAVVLVRDDPGLAGPRLVAYLVEQRTKEQGANQNQEPRTKNQEPEAEQRRPEGTRNKEQGNGFPSSPTATEPKAWRGLGQGARGEGLLINRGEGLTVGELRSFLGARLPEYMIPSAFVMLDQLPLTTNGKLDRKALPDPDHARPAFEESYTAPRTPLEQRLVELWQDLLGVTTIGVHDNFFALGGNSIQAALMVNQLQTALQEIVYVVAIFDAPTVAELAGYLASRYPQAVARIAGEHAVAEIEAAVTGSTSPPKLPERIDQAEIARFREMITPLPPRKNGARTKNPPMVFVLSPPRSGSTLLRVMLAGHSRLFAPPELELLSFNTLGERKAAFTGRDRFWLEGTIRAIMALKECDAAAAEQIMAQYEAQDLGVQDFYAELQRWLGDRMLVDKTPSYALDRAMLERAEQDFADARYIHLIRHPYGMIRSFEEAKLDQIFFRRPHGFTTRELAELIWLISHQNILDFFAQIPAQRQHTVHFEDLVRDPAGSMEQICAFLGLDLDPAMLQPYADTQQRMTDGPHAASRMLGDVKFHEHQRINAATSERWRDAYAEDFLGDRTWQLAAQLGYEAPRAATSAATLTPILPQPRTGDDRFACSFAQQRLWFIDQLAPNSPAYNIFVALRLTGLLDQRALQRSFDTIVQRHESLRTVFEVVAGEPMQVIRPSQPVAITMIDLSAFPAAERETLAWRRATEEAHTPFDLAQGPLLRVLLLQLAQDDQILVMNVHHIISDGWSQRVLTQELMTLYAAYRSADPAASVLPPLPLQYADFSVWQRQWLQGNELAPQLAYWQRQLADVPILDLPTDYARPAIQTTNGANYQFVVSAELSQQLATLSRSEGVTLFMVLLAAFQLLLVRYTGQVDVVVGTPIAGRNRAELEGLIGFFVNTLAIRTDWSGNPTFREALQRVRTVTSEAYAHQDLPFEQIVEAVVHDRELNRHPLVQVLFTLQSAPLPSTTFPGLEWSALDIEGRTAKLDLSLALVETPQGLQGAWEYNTDLFARETIARMAEQFTVLLHAIVADPVERSGRLELLTTAERRRMLVEWNATEAAYPADRCWHTLVEAQAQRTPDAVALVFDAGTRERVTVSYGDLNARANQLAHVLREHGIRPEQRVAVALEPTVALIVSLLAIFKAGGVYVPLDPAYPTDRLRWMLADCQPALLLTEQRFLAQLPAEDLPLLCLDRDWHQIAGYPTTNSTPASAPDDLAYLIYTSGSTGQPKGVLVAQRGLLNNLAWRQRTWPLRADDRVLLNFAMSFDPSLWNICAPLGAGAQLVLISQEQRYDSAALVRTIAEQRVTMFGATPSHLAVLLKEPAISACTSLRYVFSGGEQLSAEVQQLFYATLDATLCNCYGPTEATIDTTFWISTRGDAAQAAPIGRPLPNMQVYLLDRQLEPVPVGVAGELYIGGDGLARGYHRRPDVTAERFVPHPFSETPGARLYKTGDLARYRADGTIEFLGRIDHQVKVRGFRIELGEIEAALLRQPGVQAALVVARTAASSDTQLVAYVVAQPAQPVTDRDLLAALRQFLPAYMLPSAIVVLDALPLTPNGKVDLKALALFDDQPSRTSPFVAPRTLEEWRMARLWEEVLARQPIGVTDNFFELGGHSLLSVRLLAKIQQEFGSSPSLMTLLQAPTVEQLVTALRHDPAAQHTSSLVPLQPAGERRPFFCVHAVGGTVLAYADLAQRLPTDRPFYGLQAQGLAAGQAIYEDIPTMARIYLREIRSIQPEGPYLLGGWSLGGVIAFEMARQLRQQGQQVALLALLDSAAPGANAAVRDTTALVVQFAHDLGRLYGQELMIQPDEVRDLTPPQQLEYVLTEARQRAVVPPTADLESFRRLAAVFQSNLQALVSYTPRPLPVSLALLQAADRLQASGRDLAQGWQRLADVVTTHVVAGDHHSIMRPPHVEALAKWLSGLLEEL